MAPQKQEKNEFKIKLTTELDDKNGKDFPIILRKKEDDAQQEENNTDAKEKTHSFQKAFTWHKGSSLQKECRHL